MNARVLPPDKFQMFFQVNHYIRLKNYLYNYLLRKRAIAGVLGNFRSGWVLEVGTGISPVSDTSGRTVFTDISLRGLMALKEEMGEGIFVVADATALPFKSQSMQVCIGSEVLEHIGNDQLALQEMARVLKTDGRCLITFPHRVAYYAIDDAYVNHHGRYNLAEVFHKLKLAGLSPRTPIKVLGPLEKITMIIVVFLIRLMEKKQRKKQWVTGLPEITVFKWINRTFALLAWLDAKIMPRSMSAVLLIESQRKDNSPADGPGKRSGQVTR